MKPDCSEECCGDQGGHQHRQDEGEARCRVRVARGVDDSTLAGAAVGPVASRWPGSARSPSIPIPGALHRSREPQPYRLLFRPPVETGWEQGCEDMVSPTQALSSACARHYCPQPRVPVPRLQGFSEKPVPLKLPLAPQSPCFARSGPWDLPASRMHSSAFLRKDFVTLKRKQGGEKAGPQIGPFGKAHQEC